eukprot:11686164-Karenia_brevis.AAC.1
MAPTHMQTSVDTAIPGLLGKSIEFQWLAEDHGSRHITASWHQTVLNSHFGGLFPPAATPQDPFASAPHVRTTQLLCGGFQVAIAEVSILLSQRVNPSSIVRSINIVIVFAHPKVVRKVSTIQMAV